MIRADGRRETWQYEYGAWQPAASGPGSFTVDENGRDLRKTVVYGTVSQPDGIEGKSTSKVSIVDRRGNTVFTETRALVGGSFQRIAWEVKEYDLFHHQTRNLSSTGTERELAWVGDK